MAIYGHLPYPLRRRRLAVAAPLCAAALALSLGASPANAIVANVGGHAYGVTPITDVNPASIAGAYQAPASLGLSTAPGARGFDESPNAGGPLIDHGGPVMTTNDTHVIYWDPNGEFSPTTKRIVNKFFTDVAHDSGLASNVFGVDAQYGAAYSSTYAGESTDKTTYPSSGDCSVPAEGDAGPPYTTCLYDSQLQSELSAYITANSLPTGPTQLYFLLLPHKVVTCYVAGECSNNVLCAYHSYMKGGEPNEIIYADIPFTLLDSEPGHAKECQYDENKVIQAPNGDTAGTNESTRYADVALKYVSHEYSEAITDPLLNKWFDAKGLENGDKCNAWYSGSTTREGADKHAFLPTLGGSAAQGSLFDQLIDEDHYYLQSEWDNATSACLMKPALSASFSSSPASSVRVGTPVSFSGSGVDPYGSLSYSWSFGDGGTGVGSAPSHTYTALGTYTVMMTAADALTGALKISHTVAVNDVPTASFTASSNAAVTGAAVSFDGSGSSDPDGSIASYAWSFGDSSSASGATPSHAYGAPGIYTVTLTVTDSAGETAGTSQQVTVTAASGGSATANAASGGSTAAGSTATVIPPESSFTMLGAPRVNARTGAITFRLSVSAAGSFGWMLTFQNGRFGAFSARSVRCRGARVRLAGACRPSAIVFARGKRTVSAPGTLTFTVKPSASGMKALKNALRKKKGLPVAARLSFQSSRGGSSVSRSQALTVKLSPPFRGSGYGSWPPR